MGQPSHWTGAGHPAQVRSTQIEPWFPCHGPCGISPCLASRVWHMLFLQRGRPFLPFLDLAYHPCSEELRSAITCLSVTPTTLPGVPLLASTNPELPTPGANHTIVSRYLLAFSSRVPNTQPGMKQAPSKCLWS